MAANRLIHMELYVRGWVFLTRPRMFKLQIHKGLCADFDEWLVIGRSCALRGSLSGGLSE